MQRPSKYQWGESKLSNWREMDENGNREAASGFAAGSLG